MQRSVTLAMTAVALAMAACSHGVRRSPERIFFAVQIEEEGSVLASPKLLGQSGRPVLLRMVDPVAPDRTKLALQLDTTPEGRGYQVRVGLELPGEDVAPLTGNLQLLHGEERQLRLWHEGRPVNVRLLLLRVDSPEFKAFLKLA